MFREKIKAENSNGWNVHDFLKDKSVEEINDWCDKSRKNFSVCMLSITGELNIGVILRTAHSFGAKSAFILGRRFYDKRSTVGCYHYIPLHRIAGLNPEQDDIEPTVFYNAMVEHNLAPIFVETGGEILGNFSWNDKISNIPSDKTPCFVFGSEGNGIPESILAMQEEFGTFTVGIPQCGAIRSLNVSAAASIVLWDFVKETGNV